MQIEGALAFYGSLAHSRVAAAAAAAFCITRRRAAAGRILRLYYAADYAREREREGNA